MPWRVVVEALPGAAPVEANPVEVDATSWVVALRTARERLGLAPADPRQLAVEVRDTHWRVADRALGRLFIVEALKAPSAEVPAPSLAPAAPPDIVCEVRTRLPKSESQPFEYIEEVLVAARFCELEDARSWLKLRLAAWREFREASAPPLLLRIFCFEAAPPSPQAEPAASLEFRSWSGATVLQPVEDAAPAADEAPAPRSAPSASRAPASEPRAAASPEPASVVDPAPAAVANGSSSRVSLKQTLVGSAPPPRPSMNSQGDLIGSIFDSVHDVHFAPTVLDGADLVCDIAFRNIPCHGAFLYLHDINTAGWILAAGSGEGAARYFGDRLPSTDPLMVRMTQRGASLRVSGEACVHALHAGKLPSYALLASAASGGRLYAVLELVVGSRGEPFAAEHENALAYLAEQFAAFAASRGILVRENDILARRRA